MTTDREIDPQRLQILLQAMASGDAAASDKAAEEVFYKYMPMLSRYARTLVRAHNVQDAEDAVQNTFMAVFKSPLAFKSQSNYSTYLIAMLKNKVADHYRKERHRHANDTEPLADTLPDTPADQSLRSNPEATAESARAMRQYQNCFAQLTTLQKEIMSLLLDHRWSETEASDWLKCPVGTVKSRYASARQALRKCMEPWRREMRNA